MQDISSRQAEGIARTEVNSAANRGNFLAIEEAQVEYVQWIVAQDSRTRPSHVAHHGLVVRRGERFPNGLRHPGDRDAAVGYPHCSNIQLRRISDGAAGTQGELIRVV
jgi:uncharacterized protein with gpF-like domain